jgi:RimJ/RimL family protein N-acetyltransferase
VITTPLDEAAPTATAGAAGRPAPRTARFRDGRSVRVRPIRPSDAEALREFDGGLCEACRRFRYLGWMRPLTPEQALAMATVEFQERFALVATTRTEGREVIVADCRLIAEAGQPAEIAIAVADDHQGVGLGPALIRQMLSIAADHGIEVVEGRVRYDNERMMRVLRRLGFERRSWELGVVTFVVSRRDEASTACRPPC